MKDRKHDPDVVSNFIRNLKRDTFKRKVTWQGGLVPLHVESYQPKDSYRVVEHLVLKRQGLILITYKYLKKIESPDGSDHYFSPYFEILGFQHDLNHLTFRYSSFEVKELFYLARRHVLLAESEKVRSL